jgi:hypothetical protein
MEIKMPIKFHANYKVIIRTGDWEARERAQKLTVRLLAEDERVRAFKDMNEEDRPTHQITFYDFGCKRVIEGKLKENKEDRLIFLVKDKEYEFSSYFTSRQ